jgi:MFS family permease
MTVFLLMFAQACFLAYSMTMIAFSGLAGKMIAADPSLATVPVSLTLIVTALSTGPLSGLMQRFSRRTIFLSGAFSGVLGALLAAFAVYIQNFYLFCFATILIGPFQASAQYYRFAAGESVSAKKAPHAISLVLLGGLFAALVTPIGNGFLNEYFAPHTFVGAFLFSASMALLVFVPLILLPRDKAQNQGRSRAAEKTLVTPQETPRPFGVIARQPSFIVAVVNGALGYAMMTFVMTATPLAMAVCGFSPDTSSKVIATHVVAMFLPSLFTGMIIVRIGVLPVLLAGQTLFAAAFLTANSGIMLWDFSVALIALGVGWNFCFVGGTSLLTRMHSEVEKGRVQGVNEMLVFGSSAAASLAAGAIQAMFGWNIVNRAAFVILAIAAVITILWAVRGKTKSAAAA